MSRYMRSDLLVDITAINLEAMTSERDTYLVATARNGYTALDEHRIADKRCIRNIECGNPRRCLDAAMLWSNAVPPKSPPQKLESRYEVEGFYLNRPRENERDNLPAGSRSWKVWMEVGSLESARQLIENFKDSCTPDSTTFSALRVVEVSRTLLYTN